MFAIAVSDTFLVPVRVEVLDEKGLKKVHVFKAEFKRLDQDQLDAMNERLAQNAMTDQQVIDEVMVGWADVTDMNKQPLPFTPDNLAALLRVNPTRFCIVKTYFETVNAGARKN